MNNDNIQQFHKFKSEMGHPIEKKVKCFDVSPGFIQETHNVFFSNSCTHIMIYDRGKRYNSFGFLKQRNTLWAFLDSYNPRITCTVLLELFNQFFFYLKLLVFWVMTLRCLVCGWLLISYRLHNMQHHSLIPFSMETSNLSLLPCYCEIRSMKRKVCAVAGRTKAWY